MKTMEELKREKEEYVKLLGILSHKRFVKKNQT